MIPNLLFSLQLLLLAPLVEVDIDRVLPPNQDSIKEIRLPQLGHSEEAPYWAGQNLQEARKEARNRRVPLILVVLRDGDPVCKSWAGQHLNDKDFLNTLEKYGVPALVSLPDTNGQAHKPSESNEDSCPIAGCEKCKDHSESEVLSKGVPIPQLLPRIYLQDPDSKETRTIPEDLPFRGAKALTEYFQKRSKESQPTRTQYRFLLKHLKRAQEYNDYENFEKGCQELAAAKRLLPLFGQEMTDQWDVDYAPYRGRGIQMIRKAKEALKTNRILGARMLTRIAKTMAGLPEGERARHLLNALKPSN